MFFQSSIGYFEAKSSHIGEMKEISYIFWNLNIILGILSGKTRYVLIEIGKDQVVVQLYNYVIQSFNSFYMPFQIFPFSDKL